ncbi:MAG: hypothetical protein Q4D51_08720 [Eubacteriales bacterium]|nr:hypothetical protein [Eubacteriales bacterium]
MKKTNHLFRLTTLGLVLCFSLVGCGNTSGSTSGNNDNNTTDNAANDMGTDVGNAVGDLANGAGDAVGDVADGVGNAVDDLVGNGGFDNYNDAHDYFMDTMSAYHSDAKFEIRDEDKELNDYQEGSKGYRFKLYDTSKNDSGDLFGEFYVDANSGQIYQKDKSGKINEYPGTNNDSASGSTTNNGTNKNAGTNTGMRSANNNRSGNDETNNQQNMGSDTGMNP